MSSAAISGPGGAPLSPQPVLMNPSKTYGAVIRALENLRKSQESSPKTLSVKLVKIDVSLDEMKAMASAELENLETALKETIEFLRINSGEARIKLVEDLLISARKERTLRHILSLAREGRSAPALPEKYKDKQAELALIKDGFRDYLAANPRVEDIIGIIDYADDERWNAMKEVLQSARENGAVQKAMQGVRNKVLSEAKEALQGENVGVALLRLDRLYKLDGEAAKTAFGAENMDAFVEGLFRGRTVTVTLQHPPVDESSADLVTSNRSLPSQYEDRTPSIRIEDDVITQTEKPGQTARYLEKIKKFLERKRVLNPRRVAYELMLRSCGDLSFEECLTSLPQLMKRKCSQSRESAPAVGTLAGRQPERHFFVRDDGTCVVRQTYLIKDRPLDEKPYKKTSPRFVWTEVESVLDPKNPPEDRWQAIVKTRPYTGEDLAKEVLLLEEHGKKPKEALAQIEKEIKALPGRDDGEKRFFITKMREAVERAKKASTPSSRPISPLLQPQSPSPS